MPTTIQELRQQLTDISRAIEMRLNGTDLNQHDRNNLKVAETKVDAARAALFACESQS